MINVRVDASREGAILSVRVQPRAKREGVVGVHDGALKVALRAPPVDGAANAALLRCLAKTFEVPMRTLSISTGTTGRKKRILFSGIDPVAIRQRISSVLGLDE